MLMENVTNLEKPAIDYYHFDFASGSAMAMPQTWGVLLSLGKYGLIRLPSCSAENEFDYQMYVKRLHHCLWRRWSIEHFGLKHRKLNPLEINWNKEQDLSVMYGPDLEITCKSLYTEVAHIAPQASKSGANADADLELCGTGDELDASLGSSLDSRASSIFDHVPPKPCLKRNVVHENRAKSLHFDDQVLRREIDRFGELFECTVTINDVESELDSDFEPDISYPRVYVDECFEFEIPDSDSDCE